jgi:hypothetical protein
MMLERRAGETWWKLRLREERKGVKMRTEVRWTLCMKLLYEAATHKAPTVGFYWAGGGKDSGLMNASISVPHQKYYGNVPHKAYIERVL